MRNECNVIKDLMPLYYDGMVSEETAVSDKEHLAQCSACALAFSEFQGQMSFTSLSADPVLPLKSVKRKLQVRRIIAALLGIFFSMVIVFVAFYVRPVVIEYGVSEVYEQQDMDAAIAVIRDQFDSFEGCKLFSVRYTDDDFCQRELDYCNILAPDGITYDACIVFRTEFRSPIFGGGAWNANHIYDWSWYLARTGDGNWELLTWGMP